MNNTLSQFVKVFKNILTPEQCQRLILHFETNDQHWGPVTCDDGTFDVNLDVKKAKQVRIHNDREDDQEVDTILFESIGPILQEYATSTNDFYPPMAFRDGGYQIQKYERGEGFYKLHNDTNAPSNCNRILAIVWYLNTVKEGGETEFAWGKTIKPKAGSVLVFPANWLYAHRAITPIDTAKYVATSWIGF